MRTTLNLDEDVLQVATRLAKARRSSLGKAVSELARKGFSAPVQVRIENGLTLFELSSQSPMITAESIKRLESQSA